MSKFTYQHTMYACFIGYIVQAIVNNFVPLLFVMFQESYGIPLTQITTLITINFVIQLAVDLLSAKLVDKIGYRVSAVVAHICAAAGLILLAILPALLPDTYTALLIAVVVYAIGGGLIEVLISPIIEACPTDSKEQAMSLLHSFYCWGAVGVVLLSTVFFATVGIAAWQVLTILWALIPIANTVLFLQVPIYSIVEEGEQGLSIRKLCGLKEFWLLILMMACAGASEQSVSQWASTFTEMSLGVSKTAGDLAGPMMFALLMGTARAIYGKFGDKLDLDKFMLASCLLCFVTYLGVSLVPNAIINLLCCGICGFAVGIMWPGTFSKAAASIKNGGTALFALLALAGDLGCSGGPTLTGLISSANGGNLKAGLLVASIFPALLLVGILLFNGQNKEEESN